MDEKGDREVAFFVWHVAQSPLVIAPYVLDAWAEQNKGYTPEQARDFIENGLLPSLNTMVDKVIETGTSLHELAKE